MQDKSGDVLNMHDKKYEHLRRKRRMNRCKNAVIDGDTAEIVIMPSTRIYDKYMHNVSARDDVIEIKSKKFERAKIRHLELCHELSIEYKRLSKIVYNGILLLDSRVRTVYPVHITDDNDINILERNIAVAGDVLRKSGDMIERVASLHNDIYKSVGSDKTASMFTDGLDEMSGMLDVVRSAMRDTRHCAGTDLLASDFFDVRQLLPRVGVFEYRYNLFESLSTIADALELKVEEAKVASIIISARIRQKLRLYRDYDGWWNDKLLDVMKVMVYIKEATYSIEESRRLLSNKDNDRIIDGFLLRIGIDDLTDKRVRIRHGTNVQLLKRINESLVELYKIDSDINFDLTN